MVVCLLEYFYCKALVSYTKLIVGFLDPNNLNGFIKACDNLISLSLLQALKTYLVESMGAFIYIHTYT
ncbi:hypothetical protein HanIR_Chr10g0499881 [Helianthus annuus]|nr:hypothetical protein HanIR_Chr10g0499881 [Helianthus annuus]